MCIEWIFVQKKPTINQANHMWNFRTLSPLKRSNFGHIEIHIPLFKLFPCVPESSLSAGPQVDGSGNNWGGTSTHRCSWSSLSFLQSDSKVLTIYPQVTSANKRRNYLHRTGPAVCGDWTDSRRLKTTMLQNVSQLDLKTKLVHGEQFVNDLWS